MSRKIGTVLPEQGHLIIPEGPVSDTDKQPEAQTEQRERLELGANQLPTQD